jgi:hypothetical protein
LGDAAAAQQVDARDFDDRVGRGIRASRLDVAMTRIKGAVQMTAMASISMSQRGCARAVTPTSVEAGAFLPKKSSRIEASSARCRIIGEEGGELHNVSEGAPPASTWAFKAS